MAPGLPAPAPSWPSRPRPRRRGATGGRPDTRVEAVKDGEATVATYRFDALGRRVEKDVEEGVFERYVYAGLETVATYGASNAWKQDFVFGQGIDQILMLEQADVLDADEDENTSETTRSFYHRNALGSVMAITEMDEDVAVSYRYDPYGAVTITRGEQTQQTDPLGQHWTFTARFYDEESRAVLLQSPVLRSHEGQIPGTRPAGPRSGAESPLLRRQLPVYPPRSNRTREGPGWLRRSRDRRSYPSLPAKRARDPA